MAVRDVRATSIGGEVTGPRAWRLLDELRRRVGSAPPEELRALVESLLAALPAGDAPLAPDRDAEGPEP